MHMRTILAIARKDALDTVLNRSALITVLSPIVIAIFYAVLNGVISGKTTDILIYNAGNSGIEQIVSSGWTNVKITHAHSADEVTSAFGPDGAHRKTSYTLGLVVPADFDANLRAGQQPPLGLLVNGLDVSEEQSQLLMRALTDYARGVSSPKPPVQIALTTINPVAKSSPSQDFGTYVAMLGFMSSLFVGAAVVSGLLLEEKERKTMRMLMVSPASFADVVAGKLLVGLGYQLVLTGVVLLIQGGFIGQVGLVLLFTFLGSCLGLVMGLLFGGIAQTTGSIGGFVGVVSFVFIIPAMFVGPLASLLSTTPVIQIMKVLPTYYLAEGTLNAMQHKAMLGTTMLDLGIVLSCTVVIFMAAVWGLRRQAAVAATI